MRNKLAIVALLACAANDRKNISQPEGTPPATGGGGNATAIDPADVARLRLAASLLDDQNSRIASARASLVSLFPGEIGDTDDILSRFGSYARECKMLRDSAKKLTEQVERNDEAAVGLAKLGKAILEAFPDLKVAEGETVTIVAERIIRAHAEKYEGLPAAAMLVEGGSAIHRGKDGKGVASVYVIGVSTKEESACIYATPPRLIPLKELEPVKRGHPISSTEVALRNTAFPAIVWDERTGD